MRKLLAFWLRLHRIGATAGQRSPLAVRIEMHRLERLRWTAARVGMY